MQYRNWQGMYCKFQKGSISYLVKGKGYSYENAVALFNEDKIYIWNDGEMPANLSSTEKIFQKHLSKPYNPKLANVFLKVE